MGDRRAARIALTVGPVLYYWPRDALLRFYADLVQSPVDTIVLGEVVCSRRHEMKTADWLALAADLSSAGKEVVLATQALIESEADLRVLRRIAEQGDFLVEAGDASALNMLTGAGAPFVLGPHINVYSRAALDEYARLGAVRWVAPVELPLSAVREIHDCASPLPGALPTEYFGFGRMPLAFSARCFTARHHRLSKDQCEFRCLDDTDGLLLSTDEGRAFLVLNGIQTQSAAQQCLIAEGPALAEAGISRLRLSPCASRFDEVVRIFDAVLNHGSAVGEALASLHELALPGGLADGFAHARAGLEWSHA